MQQSTYFDVRGWVDPAEADRQLIAGSAQFVLHFPPDFSRDLWRGERPQLLLEADATDPSATAGAVHTLERLVATAWTRDLGLAPPPAAPVDLVVHERFNPAAVTQFNIVPGLMGVILTMTMVMITALALTRERERGTMESLLALPFQPAEIMVGKIVPYILVGIVQVVLTLVAAHLLFRVPLEGSAVTLMICTLVFICANLAMGVTFSSLAQNQLQAMQMSFFFFLPSLLLSGFMFPFRGMPVWAQWVGEVFPLTHFMRIVRGILLKGAGWSEIWPEMLAISVFLVVVTAVGVNRFRRTLD
jgi:ABC-2 type transport system permease protein